MSKQFVLLILALGTSLAAGAQLKPGEILVPVQVIVEQAPDSELWFRKSRVATAKLNSKATCVVHGGKWERMGMRGLFGCNLPTPDAGKSCTADSDCAMICTPIGESVARVGRCSPTFNIYGCLRGMKDGVSTTTLCID